MTWVATAVVGSTVIGGALSSRAQSKASSTAAGAQTEAAALGVEENRRQFDVVQELLKPFIEGGTSAFTTQQALAGLAGPEAERSAIDQIIQGPLYEELAQQGENAILQRGSATGGLRGGNIQAALAQFRPQLLNQLIESRYAKLAGLSQAGQASAAQTAAGAQTTGTNIANLYQQSGAAQAGQALAQGKAQADLWGNVSGAVGQAAGLGLLGKF